MRKRIIDNGVETIPFDDPRMQYYYQPWEKSMTGDGPIIRTDKYNDYVDIWYIKLVHLQWWAEKSPTSGVAGFKIWGKDWEIQELIDLYSPTKDSKIELIKAWNFPLDDYTITLLNTGEKWGESLGNTLSHAYFKISLEEGFVPPGILPEVIPPEETLPDG
jgi:hypothetical protein